jgi:hypothetical protein
MVGRGTRAFPVALMQYQRIPYVSGENPHNLYLELASSTACRPESGGACT